MGLDPRGMEWPELALRFAAFQDGVSTCIVGTTRLEHLADNLRMLQKGPLPSDQVAEIRSAFTTHDAGWDGQI